MHESGKSPPADESFNRRRWRSAEQPRRSTKMAPRAGQPASTARWRRAEKSTTSMPQLYTYALLPLLREQLISPPPAAPQRLRMGVGLDAADTSAASGASWSGRSERFGRRRRGAIPDVLLIRSNKSMLFRHTRNLMQNGTQTGVAPRA